MILDSHTPTNDMESYLVLFLPPFTPRPFIHPQVLPTLIFVLPSLGAPRTSIHTCAHSRSPNTLRLTKKKCRSIQLVSLGVCKAARHPSHNPQFTTSRTPYQLPETAVLSPTPHHQVYQDSPLHCAPQHIHSQASPSPLTFHPRWRVITHDLAKQPIPPPV